MSSKSVKIHPRFEYNAGMSFTSSRKLKVKDAGIPLAPCPVCAGPAVFIGEDGGYSRNHAVYRIFCRRNDKHKVLYKGHQEVSLSMAMRWNDECAFEYAGKIAIADEVAL